MSRAPVRIEMDTERRSVRDIVRDLDRSVTDHYRSETLRLRANIDQLIDYCERKSAELSATGSSWNHGAAESYGELARKLIVAAYCNEEQAREALK